MNTTTHSDSVVLNPSGYTGLTSLTTTSSYPVTNGYTDSSSTTYARFTLSTSRTGYLYFTFDTSDIPSGATIDSVACTVKVRVNSTSRVTSTKCQLYTGTTAKGSNSTFASTSTSHTVTLSTGTWTRSELNNLRLKIGATGSSSTQSKYIYFYGADVTIAYSYNETTYTITLSNSAGITTNPSASSDVLEGNSYALSLYPAGTSITVTDNGTDVTSQLVETTPSGGGDNYYVYTISNVSQDHTIAVALANMLYVKKKNEGWTAYSKAYKKIDGAWVEQDVSEAFDANAEWDTSQSGGMGDIELIPTVAYFNGKYYAICSEDSTVEFLLFESSDGLNYTEIGYVGGKQPRTTMPITILNGYMFIFQSYGDYLVYSNDGSTWTSVDTGGWDYTSGRAKILYGNGIYLLTSGRAYNLRDVKYSTDLATWTDIDFSDRTGNNNICIFADGKFIMYYENGYAETSIDAVNWVATSYSGMSTCPYQIEYDNGIFVATLDGKVAYSTDGFAWNEVSLSDVNEYSHLLTGGGEFVIAMDTSSSSSLMTAHSKDGKNWTMMPVNNINDRIDREDLYNTGVAACFTGEKFYVVGFPPGKYGDYTGVPNIATYTPKPSTKYVKGFSPE